MINSFLYVMHSNITSSLAFHMCSCLNSISIVMNFPSIILWISLSKLIFCFSHRVSFCSKHKSNDFELCPFEYRASWSKLYIIYHLIMLINYVNLSNGLLGMEDGLKKCTNLSNVSLSDNTKSNKNQIIMPEGFWEFFFVAKSFLLNWKIFGCLQVFLWLFETKVTKMRGGNRDTPHSVL